MNLQRRLDEVCRRVEARRVPAQGSESAEHAAWAAWVWPEVLLPLIKAGRLHELLGPMDDELRELVLIATGEVYPG